MSKPKDPIVFVNHILEAIQDIGEYRKCVTDYNEFVENEMIQDAIIRKLEIIGEATSNLSDEFISSHPQVSWRGPKTLRNVLAHQYFDVNLETVWEVIERDLPILEKEIKNLHELS